MNQFYPREARKDFLYTKMAVLVLVFAVAGFFAVWSFQQGVQYGLIALSPVKSDGRILSVDEGVSMVTFRFRYDDEQLRRHEGRLNQRPGLALDLKPGDDVAVLYWSFRPDVAQLERNLPMQALSFYILLGCALIHIATTAFGLQTIRQINALAAEDIYY